MPDLHHHNEPITSGDELKQQNGLAALLISPIYRQPAWPSRLL